MKSRQIFLKGFIDKQNYMVEIGVLSAQQARRNIAELAHKMLKHRTAQTEKLLENLRNLKLNNA